MDGQGVEQALELYRSLYRPSERHPTPQATICVWALAADGEDKFDRKDRRIFRPADHRGIIDGKDPGGAFAAQPIGLGRRRAGGQDLARIARGGRAGREVGANLEVAIDRGIAHGHPADGHGRIGDGGVMQGDGLAGHDLGLRHEGLHGEPETGLNEVVELGALVVEQRIRGQPGQLGADCEERGDGGRRNFRVEFRRGVLGEPVYLGATGHAVPGHVHAVHEVLRGGLAAHQDKSLDAGAAGRPRGKEAEALGLVHAATAVGEGAKRLAGHRIAAADVQLDGRSGQHGAAAARTKSVPDHALRLPRGQALCELIGERLGVGRELEGLDGEDGRGRVMAVAAAAGRDREARDDDVGPELPDHAHDVAEHLAAVPEAERFLRGLRVAEVDRAGEELAPAVEPARGEQLLRAGQAEFLVEVAPELVLAAVAAGERQVGGAVAAAPGEVGDELRVLIVRMGADMEHGAHRAEIPQFLRDGGGVRRRRRAAGCRRQQGGGK